LLQRGKNLCSSVELVGLYTPSLIHIVTMLSKAASMVAGVLIAHFYSDGFFPSSHAAWSWECTYYTGGDIKTPVYMAVNATTGPTCADKSKLSCSCPATPCKGKAAALPSNLVCAGAGDDAATKGCFKLHHTYGTPAHAVVAGRGAAAQVTDACGAADIIKVYGNADGLAVMVSWGALTNGIIDNSTQPSSAQACQTLCAGNAACKFFTFNDQGSPGGNYMYFRGLCILHKALNCTGTKTTAYSTFHGAIAGPSACPAGVTVPAAPTPTPAPTPAPAGALKDIVDTAVAAGNFKVLAEALTKADLVTTAKSAGPFTVFAPTDAAFAAALKTLGATKAELLARKDLKSILTYHLVSGKVMSTDLTNGMTPATVNGAKVTIAIDGSKVTVNKVATVTTADVKCSNGVIHIIDAVLLPPSPSPSPEPEPAPSPAGATTTAAAGVDASHAAQTSYGFVSLAFAGILSAFVLA